MILAGDIGGTKCNLALVDQRDGVFQIGFKEHFPTHEYSRFEDMIDAFLDAAKQASANHGCRRANSGGRVWRGRSRDGQPGADDQCCLGARRRLAWNTNSQRHTWSCSTISRPLAILCPGSSPSSCSVSTRGVPAPRAAQALLAAGTGLGEAILHWDGSRYVVAPSEGGHCDFAPRNEKEIELLRHMKKPRRARQL